MLQQVIIKGIKKRQLADRTSELLLLLLFIFNVKGPMNYFGQQPPPPIITSI
ncbi:hypothetical protein OIU84_012828 [Salix udensis]|uniref:Uncharacterized protein n=1 Tax=Salix udensis TaxID=889485 RepID=A0AAD6JGK3_9ROSI|nr:hypothetical protein OIU84_012828 [Salix udensis]